MGTGNYEILRLLGKGGMAEVFRVRAVAGRYKGRELALKRLLPALRQDAEAVRLFTAEAELSRHLHHANIVEVLDVGHDADDIYIVMDFIDGRDVAQIIKRCRQNKVPWPIDFALYLSKALLEALDYAHHAKAIKGYPLHTGFFFQLWDRLAGSTLPEADCFCARCEQAKGLRSRAAFAKIDKVDYQPLLSPSFWLKGLQGADDLKK